MVYTNAHSTTAANADGTITVKLTDEQLNKIIPKNEDGSINIRLSEEQLKTISPGDVQDVNLVQTQKSRSSRSGFTINQ